jgi:hypothetical protein
MNDNDIIRRSAQISSGLFKVSERPSIFRNLNPGPSMAPANAPTASAADCCRCRRSSRNVVANASRRSTYDRTSRTDSSELIQPTTWNNIKDNHDKLNLEGVDQKEMEEYRKSLDTEREGDVWRRYESQQRQDKEETPLMILFGR